MRSSLSRSVLRSGALLSSCALVAMLVSCSGSEESEPAPAETPPASAPDAAPAEPADGSSPVSEKDRMRAEEWAAAIKGVVFDGDERVRVANGMGLDPGEAAARLDAGHALLLSNRATEAVAEYVLAVRAAPDDPEVYRVLGAAMIAKGKSDLARASFRSALALDAEDIETRIRLAETLAMDERRDEAIAEMHLVLERAPEHGKAHERLAVWSYYASDDAQAWEHVRAARAAGHVMPAQFITLLESRTPGG